MSHSPNSTGSIAALVAIALALAAGVVFVAGMALIATSMGGHMNGGMMGWGAGGGSPQTPVVADQAQVTVEIRDFDFVPRDLTVKAGAQVTWVNRDSAPHTATDKAGEWDTGTLNQDESKALTFDSPETYSYFCAIHPNMKATLTVR